MLFLKTMTGLEENDLSKIFNIDEKIVSDCLEGRDISSESFKLLKLFNRSISKLAVLIESNIDTLGIDKVEKALSTLEEFKYKYVKDKVIDSLAINRNVKAVELDGLSYNVHYTEDELLVVCNGSVVLRSKGKLFSNAS